VSSSIETDPNLNLVNLAAQVKGFGGKLRSATIPILGTPTIIVGGAPVSIVQINTAALPAFMKTVTSAKSASSTTPTVTPSQITLTVFNGSGVAGAAGSASTALKTAGFSTGTPQTAAIQQTTTINYPSVASAAAKVVATYFPGAKLVKTAGINQVQVVLGTDKVSVNVGAGKAAGTPNPTATTAATNSYDTQSCVN
jgi:hypothetical protein